jgi:orotate phosphoribosyltransferase-like protein
MNPLRRDVAVSSRLGKHVPTLGSVPVEDAQALAAKVAAVSSDRTHVIGMAETATGLGFLVAQALGAKTFTTTTRRDLGRECSALQFLETHSHAPSHGLCSSMKTFVEAGDTIVIVDDEATTGRTLSNLALPLSRTIPPDVGLVAAVLCDASPSAQQDSLLAARISLHQVEPTPTGEPEGLTPPDAALVRQIGSIQTLEPIGCPDPAHALDEAAILEMQAVASLISNRFDHLEPERTLVIGVEEFMPLPILVARLLSCHVQSTTRSPIYTSRDRGYPIRAGWTFPAYTDPSQSAFLYNANTEHPEWTNAILLVPGATHGVSISPAMAGCIDVLRSIFRRVWIQPVSEIRRSPCAA